MNLSERLRRLECESCGWNRVYGPEEMAKGLRNAGMLRRDAKPDHQIVIELFATQLKNVRCDACGKTGLRFGEVQDDFDDWGDAHCCEVCKQPIPVERLELFPQETRCAGCKDVDVIDETTEFCTFCGGILQVKAGAGSGVTRYRMVCSECGR